MANVLLGYLWWRAIRTTVKSGALSGYPRSTSLHGAESGITYAAEDGSIAGGGCKRSDPGWERRVQYANNTLLLVDCSFCWV